MLIRPASAPAGYSRIVRRFRIGLLFASIALIAAMFVIGIVRSGNGYAPGSSSSSSTEPNLPSNGQASGELAGSETDECSVIENSRYADVTRRGESFSVNADVASLCGSGPDQFVATNPTFDIRFQNGEGVRALSQSAKLDFVEQAAILTGGVRIETSDGTVAETSEIVVDIREKRGLSRGKVDAYGPFGALSAGMMEILVTTPENSTTPLDNKNVHTTLTFTGGVRMTINPRGGRRGTP